jgi:hypothetical protein
MMRGLLVAVPVAALWVGAAQAQNAPLWFTSGPRYERAAKCIAAVTFFPQIEDSRSQLGILQKIIADDGQMDTDLQIDVRTEGGSPRLKQIDMVMRHIYTAVRNFQSQPLNPSFLRAACRKLEAEGIR